VRLGREVDAVQGEPPGTVHAHEPRARGVGAAGQEVDQRARMVGEPEVVVGEVQDVGRGQLAQERVAVELAVPLALGSVDDPHPVVGRRDGLRRRARRVVHAVAQHHDLQLAEGLAQRAGHGQRQRGRVAVRGDHDGRNRAHGRAILVASRP
jgi:hypothetical protein